MIHKIRDWEAGESLVLVAPHEDTLRAIERNAIQFLKDLYSGDPFVVTIDVQVIAHLSINPDKQTKWTAEIETGSEPVKMTWGEIDLTVRKLRKDAIKKTLLEETLAEEGGNDSIAGE